MASTAAAAAVLGGVFLPVNLYLGLVLIAVLAAAGTLALMAQLGAPSLGLALLVCAAVAFPIEFPGPSQAMMSSPLLLATAFCGVWLLRLVVMRESARFDRSRIVWAALAFIATALLAFAVGQYPWFPAADPAPLPAQVAGLSLYLLSGSLFLAVGHQVTTLARLRRLTWLFVIAGTVTCIVQMTPSLATFGQYTTRPGSVGSLFWTWLVALTVAQAVFNRDLSTWARLALLGVAAMVLGHGLIQVRSWASGWAPPLLVVGTIALLRWPRLTVSLGVVGLPIALALKSYLEQAVLAEESYSLMTREEAWKVLWHIVERSPILGTGPANYYNYTEQFPILGWHVKFMSHNNYQDMVLQTGFVGLLVFGWFAVEAIWFAFQLYRRETDGFARGYAAAALAGVAGSLGAGMLGDWIIPFYYNAGILGFRSSLFFWLFLGGALALKRISTRAADDAPRADARLELKLAS